MTTVTGRAVGDHVCWPFHGTDDLVAAARPYVLEGLTRHERVAFCTIGAAGMQRAVVTDVAQVRRPLNVHQPVLTPLSAEPGWTPSTSPVVAFGRMTEAALAEGYAGLRIFTDATDAARDPGVRHRWLHWEHLLDRYSLGHPLTVLCGYDAADLGEEIVAEVACVHRMTGGTPCSFLLGATGNGALALSGEVDRESAALLHHAVVVIAAATSGRVVLDLSEHAFLDHTGLAALDRAAQDLDTRIDLVGVSPLTALLVDAFGFAGLSVREGS